ncbi:hypothetical protein V1511DRAFT_306394 [Dipodascopsis uninucleata]
MSVPDSLSNSLSLPQSFLSSGRRLYVGTGTASRDGVPPLKLDVDATRSNELKNVKLQNSNQIRDIASAILNQVDGLEQDCLLQTESLQQLEYRLEQRVQAIQLDLEKIRNTRDQIIALTSSLQNENARASDEYTIQFERIERFSAKLTIVDELEQRLKTAKERIENYRHKLDQIRDDIKTEEARQSDLERRTSVQRSILWNSCISGASVVLIFILYNIYKLYRS